MRIALAGLLGLLMAGTALAQTPPPVGLKQKAQVSRQATLPGNQKPVDPETLAQYVLFAASQDAQNDLKSMMAEVKTLSKTKQAQREGKRQRPTNPCQGTEAAQWSACVDAISARLDNASDADRTLLYAELGALKRDLAEVDQSKTAEIRTVKLSASQTRAARIEAILARLGKQPPP